MLAHFVTMLSCPVCVSGVVDKKGREGHTEREDKEEKERKSVLVEKEKKKSSHSKSPNTQIKKQLFSPFSFFLFDFSPFFSFSRFKNNKDIQKHANDRQERRESTECG